MGDKSSGTSTTDGFKAMFGVDLFIILQYKLF